VDVYFDVQPALHQVEIGGTLLFGERLIRRLHLVEIHFTWWKFTSLFDMSGRDSGREDWTRNMEALPASPAPASPAPASQGSSSPAPPSPSQGTPHQDNGGGLEFENPDQDHEEIGELPSGWEDITSAFLLYRTEAVEQREAQLNHTTWWAHIRTQIGGLLRKVYATYALFTAAGDRVKKELKEQVAFLQTGQNPWSSLTDMGPLTDSEKAARKKEQTRMWKVVCTLLTETYRINPLGLKHVADITMECMRHRSFQVSDKLYNW
jgi:hypothetical protein